MVTNTESAVHLDDLHLVLNEIHDALRAGGPEGKPDDDEDPGFRCGGCRGCGGCGGCRGCGGCSGCRGCFGCGGCFRCFRCEGCH